MRAQISFTKSSTNTSAGGNEAMDICLMEMLGQGSFGKVYRGT